MKSTRIVEDRCILCFVPYMHAPERRETEREEEFESGQICTPATTPACSEPNFTCKDGFCPQSCWWFFFFPFQASDLTFCKSGNYNCSHLSYTKILICSPYLVKTVMFPSALKNFIKA